MNSLKTGLLLALLMGLFLVIGAVIGGSTGMAVAFVLAAGMNLFAYWNSDRMLLSMYGARAVGEDEALYRLVAGLAQKAGLPAPKVYIADNPQPNAFATGRNPSHAAICVTSGLLAQVNDQELAGVVAHELGHVRNHDTLTMTMVAVMAGAVGMLANMAFFTGGFSGERRNPIAGIAVMMLAPVAAMLVQMAVSRTREFEADRAGAQISGHPGWLADALGRIEQAAQRTENYPADANPATAHMFIINPLHGGFSGLFASHPSTQERIARLRAMAPGDGAAPQTLQSVPHIAAKRGPWG